MVYVSSHAVIRYIQRVTKRNVYYKEVTPTEYSNARTDLITMFNKAEQVSDMRKRYENYIIVFKDKTILTIFERK